MFTVKMRCIHSMFVCKFVSMNLILLSWKAKSLSTQWIVMIGSSQRYSDESYSVFSFQSFPLSSLLSLSNISSSFSCSITTKIMETRNSSRVENEDILCVLIEMTRVCVCFRTSSKDSLFTSDTIMKNAFMKERYPLIVIQLLPSSHDNDCCCIRTGFLWYVVYREGRLLGVFSLCGNTKKRRNKTK